MRVFLKKLIKSKYLKTVSVVLGVMAVALLMVWGRAFYGSIEAFNRGETYLKEKQYIRAITFFDRSIHWYTPFNPFVQKSAEQLWTIGEQAEKEGDTQLALIAFRTIRNGFYAASHFVIPGRAWIQKSERKIDVLMGVEGRGTSEDSASLKEELLQEQNVASPSVPWTIVLEFGFLGWVGSVIGFIVFRLRHKKDGVYPASTSLLWFILFVCFFGLWVVGMMKA